MKSEEDEICVMNNHDKEYIDFYQRVNQFAKTQRHLIKDQPSEEQAILVKVKSMESWFRHRIRKHGGMVCDVCNDSVIDAEYQYLFLYPNEAENENSDWIIWGCYCEKCLKKYQKNKPIVEMTKIRLF